MYWNIYLYMHMWPSACDCVYSSSVTNACNSVAQHLCMYTACDMGLLLLYYYVCLVLTLLQVLTQSSGCV